MPEPVRVYTKDYCPYCTMAKKLLEGRGISYEEIEIKEPQEMMDLVAKSGMRTVPQIFHGEKLIGGYDQLAELDKKDALGSLK